MKKISIWIAAALCLPIGVTLAASEDYRSGDLFRASELSLDLFGTGSVGEDDLDPISGDRLRRDGRLGAGVGLNYFFTRHVGVGAEAYTEDTQGHFVDAASGNLIVRFPIESVRLAPYVFGGGGQQFDPAETCFAQGGAGVEVRVTPNIGFFADGRYQFISDSSDAGLGRLGVRFSF